MRENSGDGFYDRGSAIRMDFSARDWLLMHYAGSKEARFMGNAAILDISCSQAEYLSEKDSARGADFFAAAESRRRDDQVRAHEHHREGF